MNQVESPVSLDRGSLQSVIPFALWAVINSDKFAGIFLALAASDANNGGSSFIGVKLAKGTIARLVIRLAVAQFGSGEIAIVTAIGHRSL